MIGNRIELFERFGLCTEVSKYYGYAHRSYLVIAKLSKNSREMLDNNYEGMMNSLLKNAATVYIIKENMNFLSFPWDLFKFAIDIVDDLMVDIFFNFIENIMKKNGYYFYQHFMHERLCILNIYICSSMFEKFYSARVNLKQIKTIEDSYNKSCQLNSNWSTLLDKIIFTDINNFIFDNKHFEFPKLSEEYSLDSDIIENNSFKRLYFVYLTGYEIDDALSILADIGNKGMQFNFLIVGGNNEEESEKLTNPVYYKNGLSKFKYCFKQNHILTENFINNVNQIQPRELSFEFDYRLEGSFDYIQLLK